MWFQLDSSSRTAVHAKAANRTGRTTSIAATHSPKDAMQLNVAGVSQQEVVEWLALLKRCAKEVHSVKLWCHKNPRDVIGGRGNSRNGSRQLSTGQLPILTSEQHRTVVAESSAKLSSDKLRGCLPETLCKVLSANSLRHFELSIKLPLKMYEQLATALADNSSVEEFSLAGSCCGDAALAALLAALTSHAKLQVLKLPGCCLSDASAGRLAILLKAQGAAAAQQVWVEGLRGGGTSTSHCKALHAAAGGSGAGVLPVQAQGLRVLDASQNQITIAGLHAIAAALADEHSSLMRLNLAGNHLPGAEAAAHCILQALHHDPPNRNISVDLTGSYGPPGANSSLSEATPTIPGLGVWAGVLQYSGHVTAAHSSAAAAAAGRSCRPLSRKQGFRTAPSMADSTHSCSPGSGKCSLLAADEAHRAIPHQTLQTSHQLAAQAHPPPAVPHAQGLAEEPAQHPSVDKVERWSAGPPAGQPPGLGSQQQLQQPHEQQQWQQQKIHEPTVTCSGSMSQQLAAIQQHPSSWPLQVSPQQAYPSINSSSNLNKQLNLQQEAAASSNQTEGWAFASPRSPTVHAMPEQQVAAGQHIGDKADESNACVKQQQGQQEQGQHTQCSSSQQPDRPATPQAQVFLLEAVRQQQQVLQWLLLQQQQQNQEQQHCDGVEDEMLTELNTVMCDLSEKVTLLEQLYSSSSSGQSSHANAALSSDLVADLPATTGIPRESDCWPPGGRQSLPIAQQHQSLKQHWLLLQQPANIQQQQAAALTKGSADPPCLDPGRALDEKRFKVGMELEADHSVVSHTCSWLSTESGTTGDASSCCEYSSSKVCATAQDSRNIGHEPPTWYMMSGRCPAVDSISRQLLYLHGLS